MLTTEREIRTRNDRYGSFELRRDEKNVDLTHDDRLINSFDRIESVDTSASVAPKTKVNAGVDVIPNSKRLQVSDNYSKAAKAQNKEVAGVAPRERVKAKNILMCCAYCLVVVALIAVIALNANAIATVSTKNAALEDKITSLTAEYATKVSELSALTDGERVQTLAATTLGMTEAETNVVSMSVPTMRVVETKTYTTNWFDSICDKISSVIGG